MIPISKINWQMALSEFAVVLISILLAFAVERCGENRKDRKDAIQYLQNLKEELNDDIKELKKLDTIVSGSQQTAFLLTRHAAQILPGRDSVDLLFFRLLSKQYNFYPHNATYESMKFSGDLKLLKNLNLKRQIVEHYSEYQRIDNVQMQYNNLEKDYVAGYLMDHLDYSQFGRNGVGFDLLSDRYIKNIIYSHLGIYQSMRSNFKLAMKRCEGVIQMIDAELMRL